jgi:putative transcriptional regulator
MTRRMSENQIEDAARADPDNRPLSADDLRRMKRTPQAKVIRQALGLTQEEFAARFQIPIGTLRDWEQNRKEPDQTAKTYLKVIARLSDKVSEVLGEPPVF